MECISVNLIIEPILASQHPPSVTIFRENIQMTVTINSNTLVKDIGNVLMYRIGLGHLVRSSEAFIKCPNNNCFTSAYCFPNPDLSVGELETWNREYLTIKISVKGCIQDFSGFEGRNSIYRNLLHLLLKKYPFIENNETNPILKDIINKVENSTILSLKHTSLLSINEVLERELFFATRNEQQIYGPIHQLNENYTAENSPSIASLESNIEGNVETGITPEPSLQSLTTPVNLEYENLPSPGNLSIDDSPTDMNYNEEKQSIISVTRTPSRRNMSSQPRIKFNPRTEKPVLEEWFKTIKIPTANQLQQFADHLNQISNRPNDFKITLHNVRNWFSYRRVKEKRCSVTP